MFEECRRFGEVLAAKGLINSTDIEEARSSKGSQVISVGLPAYALLYEILRSVKANSVGLLLGKVSFFFYYEVFQFQCCILNQQETNKIDSKDIFLFLFVGDGVTEITTKNRPKDAFFDWFLNPFLILKEQLKATNLSEEEEEYLGRLVLLYGDSERLKGSYVDFVSPPLTERRRAELDAFARR